MGKFESHNGIFSYVDDQEKRIQFNDFDRFIEDLLKSEYKALLTGLGYWASRLEINEHNVKKREINVEERENDLQYRELLFLDKEKRLEIREKLTSQTTSREKPQTPSRRKTIRDEDLIIDGRNYNNCKNYFTNKELEILLNNYELTEPISHRSTSWRELYKRLRTERC